MREPSVQSTSTRRMRVVDAPGMGIRARGSRVTQAEFECESRGATGNAECMAAKDTASYGCRGEQTINSLWTQKA